MKWTYVIRQKTKAAMALGTIFVLILATNVMDKSHFSELQDSFSAVYEDRLVAEIYIYKLSAQLHTKKKVFDELNDLGVYDRNTNQALNDSIRTLLSKYEETKLTEKEALLFTALKKNITDLLLLEADHTQLALGSKRRERVGEQYRKLAVNLDGLSEIQLLEGKNLTDNSRRIIAASNVTSQLEICILIIAGLIVQALIFTSKSMRPHWSQDSSLN